MAQLQLGGIRPYVATLIIATALVAGVAAIDEVLSAMRISPVQKSLTASGALLLLGLGVNALTRRSLGNVWHSRFLLRSLALGLAAFIACALTLLGAAKLSDWRTASTVFVAASVEELIFRVFLPAQLAFLLLLVGLSSRTKAFMAQVGAQLTFAACHVLLGGVALEAADLREAARVFSGGILYANVVAQAGLWLAITVHATLNLSLLYALPLGQGTVSFAAIMVATTAGLILLFRLPSRDLAALPYPFTKES